MRRGFQWAVWLAGGAVCGMALLAADSAPLPASPSTNSIDSSALHHLSPVEFFRGLLGMTPAERERALAKRTPADRELILAKVREYEALPRNVREARLCQTELHWELFDLMKTPPAERSDRLAMVSVLYRPMIDGLLKEWDAVPAQTQKALLENQNFIGVYLRMQGSPASVQREIIEKFSPERRARWTNDLVRWESLPDDQRTALCAQFQRFYSLPGQQQQETVSALSAEERKEMEAVLQSFNRMPAVQRDICIRSFQKFATMSATERDQFLKNAARWDAMTAHERQLWRELVQTLPPMPPMPPGFMSQLPTPPMPPGFNEAPPPLPPMPPNVMTPVVVAGNTNDVR